MKFSFVEDIDIVRGQLRYSKKDHAFNFQLQDFRDAQGQLFSISVHTLEILTDMNSGRLLFMLGLCPKEGWIKSTLTPPADATKGRIYLKFQSDMQFIEGVAYPLRAHEGLWNSEILCDIENEIVIGDRISHLEPQAKVVEFATGIRAVIIGDDITAIWMKFQMQ